MDEKSHSPGRLTGLRRRRIVCLARCAERTHAHTPLHREWFRRRAIKPRVWRSRSRSPSMRKLYGVRRDRMYCILFVQYTIGVIVCVFMCVCEILCEFFGLRRSRISQINRLNGQKSRLRIAQLF